MAEDTTIIEYEPGEEKGLVAQINDRLNRELADPAALRALIATTFNGMDEHRVKQALMEGMIRGFKFEDFLHKNVYAIPYGQKYSLVTSIDHARKIGMKSGVVGKGAPVYIYKDEAKTQIESCEITIKRVVNNNLGEFTASVDFDEYYSGNKNPDGTVKTNQYGEVKPTLWDTKPKTMIAKVAEMHALRMACPEAVSEMYTEEEMQREVEIKKPLQPQRVDVVTANEEEIDQALIQLDEATDHQMMMKIYASLKPAVKMNDRVQEFITNKKFE